MQPLAVRLAAVALEQPGRHLALLGRGERVVGQVAHLRTAGRSPSVCDCVSKRAAAQVRRKRGARRDGVASARLRAFDNGPEGKWQRPGKLIAREAERGELVEVGQVWQRARDLGAREVKIL